MTLTIQRGSQAHDTLWRALTDRNATEVRVDVRPDGIAVKVDSGVWSPTLPLHRPGK